MRISTTTLESFRLFMDPEQEWMTDADMQASIRGEFRGNHNVWLGSAFGAVLETPDAYAVPGGFRVVRGGETFDLGSDVMGPALALIDREHTVFEAKAVKSYGAHTVVARADQMVGAHLIETKTTLSTFDFDKYANSMQWRFMLDIFKVSKVTYHVFCLAESEANGVISLKSVESFHLYPYANLGADCGALVHEFADYVRAHGLESYLDRPSDAMEHAA
jgi:hypothetical protein